MDKDSTGFTPVRRSTKYDQDSPRGCTASVSWTSARCKRLLRPITSRLATLRKEARCGIKEFQKPQNDLGEGMEQHGLRLDASIVSEKAPVSQNSGLDEDWLSRGPRKRIRRTYSKKDNAIQRSRHPSNTVENTPKITLVQPLLRIDQQLNLITTPFPSHLVNPPQKDDILNQSSKVSVQRNGKVSRHNFKSLARNVRPSQWVLYDGIFAGLDTLLTATAPTSLPKRTGVSSLFSTCIRKVPDWIALEEQEAIALHIDLEEDVESSIFDELENLSTSTDGCWKPFRDICRSQAILLLQRAIQDGLIPLSLADSFVHLLIDHQAIREAKTLVRTMISMVKGIRNPDNQAETFYSHEISYSLQALNRLGKDHIGFLFEMVTLLQEKGAFSKEWCTHPDFIHIWNRALYSITISDSYCARAVHLLEISMKRWGSHCFPNGRRDSTTIQSSTRDCISWATLFYDIIAALVSVLHTISMPCDLGKTPAVLPGYCRQALKSLALSADLDSFGETQDDMVHLPILALIIACPEYSNERINADSSRAGPDSKLLEVATSALGTSIRFVSEELDTPEVNVLHILVGCWTATLNSHTNFWLLHKSAIRVLQSFADNNDLKDHQDWAEKVMADYKLGISPNIERNQSEQPEEYQVVGQAVATESFRWDEKIDDFVVCSPLKLPRMASVVHEQYEVNEPSSKLDFDAVAAQVLFELDCISSQESISEYSSTDEDQLALLAQEPGKSYNLERPIAKDHLFRGRQETPFDDPAKMDKTFDCLTSADPLGRENFDCSLPAAKLIEASAQDLFNLSLDLQISTRPVGTKSRSCISNGFYQPHESKRHKILRHNLQIARRDRGSQESRRDVNVSHSVQSLDMLPKLSGIRGSRRQGTGTTLAIDDESDDELCT